MPEPPTAACRLPSTGYIQYHTQTQLEPGPSRRQIPSRVYTRRRLAYVCQVQNGGQSPASSGMQSLPQNICCLFIFISTSIFKALQRPWLSQSERERLPDSQTARQSESHTHTTKSAK